MQALGKHQTSPEELNEIRQLLDQLDTESSDHPSNPKINQHESHRTIVSSRLYRRLDGPCFTPLARRSYCGCLGTLWNFSGKYPAQYRYLAGVIAAVLMLAWAGFTFTQE